MHERGTVVVAQYVDEIGYGEHADELLRATVPYGSGAHAVLHQSHERLFHVQIRVEDDEFRAFRYERVARVLSHEIGVG